jgi:hypothetical protein
MTHPTIAAWRAAGESGDAAAAAAALSPDVEVISPLTAAFRFHGRGQAGPMLASAFEVIHDIRYHTQVGGDDVWALFYRARAGREPVEEAQLLRLGDDGLIRELTFFGRPLPALTTVMAGIGPRLLRRQRRPLLARVVSAATIPLNAAVRLGERTLLPLADPARARPARPAAAKPAAADPARET